MLSLLLGFAPVADVEAKIVAASLFKNGYAMVLREVAASNGATVTKIPVASLGTLWFTTSDGVRLRSVVNTTRETTAKAPVGSLTEYLRANKGKSATLVLSSEPTSRIVTGIIREVAGEMVYVQAPAETVAVRIGSIAIANIAGEGTTSTETKGQERVLSFHAEGTGKVFMLGLERGITWSPGYTIELTSDTELRLLAKSTVLNDLGAFENIELKFVTGFPNVPWATIREPLLSGESVDQFTNMLAGIGMPTSGFGGRRDGQMMSNQMSGGFNMPAAEMEITGTGGEMAEDLFFYSQPKVTMKQGDRAFFLLFESKSAFERLYTLDIPNTINENESYNPNPNQREIPYDVWNTIKFKNTAKQPLTTGPATVYRGGQIMGQDTLTYTSVGSEANVKMSKALDVQNDANEEETARERGALKTANYGTFDLVTIKGTIALRNRKGEAVKLRATKQILGEHVSSDNAPKITKLAKGLREVNPRTKLEWTVNLAAGKSLTLNYTYKIYVRS